MNTPQAMIISHQSKRPAEQGATARALASYATTLSIASLLEPALVISVGALFWMDKMSVARIGDMIHPAATTATQAIEPW